MARSSDETRLLAERLVSDQELQGNLSRRLTHTALAFAADMGVDCTANEFSVALAQALAPEPVAGVGMMPSFCKNGLFESQYYVNVDDLTAHADLGSLEDFLVILRGGGSWAEMSVQWMFGNPENAAIIFVVDGCWKAGNTGVLISNPVALPAVAWPANL